MTNTTSTKTLTTPTTPSFSCKFCDKQFKTKSKFNRHVREIHVDPSKTFRCEFCDKSFKRREHYLRHVRGKHLEEKFACPLCPSRHVEKSRLKTHLKKAHKLAICRSCGAFHKPSEPHTCDPKMLFMPRHLTKHGVIFDCNQCRTCFLSEEARAGHCCAKKAAPSNHHHHCDTKNHECMSTTTQADSDDLTVVSGNADSYEPSIARRKPLEPLPAPVGTKRLNLGLPRSASLVEEEEGEWAPLFPSPPKLDGLVRQGFSEEILSHEEDIFNFGSGIVSKMDCLSSALMSDDAEDEGFDNYLEGSPLKTQFKSSRQFQESSFLF